ncbi:MAG: hypothetical protein JHC33_13000 [Ignisphaera sp.]|nr:hypothetical protein [Ignisphaera sp.]
MADIMANIMDLFGNKKVDSVDKNTPPKLTPEEELGVKKSASEIVIGKDGLAGNAIQAIKNRRKILDDI